MKTLSKVTLVIYVLTLMWLVLFKFSYDIIGVLLDYQSRTLNLIPFAKLPGSSWREVIENFVVFIPFGLLLGINFKRADFWRTVGFIGAFSLMAEVIQYVFAIGITDITDLLMNTLGGMFGLALYRLGGKIIGTKWLDRFIVVVGLTLLIALILLRVLVLRVRY